MKAVVAAFNQEKALVGAFSVITNLRMDLFDALMKDLNDSLGRLSLLPPGWGGKTKIAHWLEVLSGMQVGFCSLSWNLSHELKITSLPFQASDSLDDTQARQLSFDLESAYNDFNKILHAS